MVIGVILGRSQWKLLYSDGVASDNYGSHFRLHLCFSVHGLAPRWKLQIAWHKPTIRHYGNIFYPQLAVVILGIGASGIRIRQALHHRLHPSLLQCMLKSPVLRQNLVIEI